MDTAATSELIAKARRTGVEATGLEVKAALGGLPKSLVETLSAFANGSGGTVLLGIAEGANFSPVVDFDAPAIREAAAQALAEKLTPPLRVPVEIEAFEDGRVVRIDVEPLDPADKPCFVTTKGEYYGSYIRGGEGDRRLSRYEVTQLLANRTQPVDDREIVQGATLDDLEPKAIRRLIDRVKDAQPRAFADLGDEACLMRLNAVATVDGVTRPTLAGLLTLGKWPQQFFPQLSVTVVALPHTEMGVSSTENERFLDNVTCEGTIPEIVEQAVRAVRRNVTRAATISEVGRADREEYPPAVIRELIVNAIMHRDYSADSRGSQVQVELYPDRLVVRNPGGFWGAVAPERLGEPNLSSSRNAVLARLLTDVTLPSSTETVCENRGSGIPTVMMALKQAGFSPAKFRVDPGMTEVAVPKHALLDEETLNWVVSLDQPNLSDHQVMALAAMRTDGSVSNGTLQGWGLHSSDATRQLADLVARGLAIRRGSNRYATYELADSLLPSQTSSPVAAPPTAAVREVDEVIFNYLLEVGEAGTGEIQDQFDLSYPVALRAINRLIAAQRVEPTAGPTSRSRRYRPVKGLTR